MLIHLSFTVFTFLKHHILKSKHLVTHVVTDLVGLIRTVHLELLPRLVLQDRLALLIGTFVFLTPLLVLTDEREKDLVRTRTTIHLQDVNKFLENVGAWPDSQLAWALEWTIFLPFFDAPPTEQFTTIITLFRLPQNFKTNTANQLVPQLLVHESILYAVEVIAARIVGGSAVGVVLHVNCVLIHLELLKLNYASF